MLGAGASEPFGYPFGEGLRKIICQELNYLQIAQMLTSDHEKDMVPDTERAINNFRTHFDKSGENSIDLFLKNNQEFRNLGKQLIAAALLHKENEPLLFRRDDGKNWYIELWNNIDHTFENIDKHNMHFITFNYDRSLEHFLITALYNSYSGKKVMGECAKKINSIEIIHVYGCLAPLPWQNQEEGRPYLSQEANRRDLIRATKNLFIIGEERTGDAQATKLNRIQSLAKEAAYIYFLGFSYGDENLNILGDSFNKAGHIWGTSLGLGEVAKSKTKKLIKQKYANEPLNYLLEGRETKRFDLFDVDVATFLRQYMHLS